MPTGLTFDAIQVDGGSEVKKHFEAYCKEHTIPLLVNRPRTPTQNCYVERVHGTFDRECYQTRDMGTTLKSINWHLEDFCMFYNAHRFHAGIGYMTPCQKVEELIKIRE